MNDGDASLFADVVAFFALIVSLVTFIWSRFAERRIRLAADRKGTFDAWLMTPIETQLASLSQIVGEFVLVLRENEDAVSRTAEARRIQRGKFSTWCVDVFGFCDSQGDQILVAVRAATSDLIDVVSDQMNDLSEDAGTDVIASICERMTAAKHAYTARVRGEIQSARLAVK